MNKKIKAMVIDVDGTLTDGKIYMGSSGEIMKAFHVRDGYGIHDELPKLGITPIIITGRKSDILLNRCNELGVKFLIQGSKNKVNDMIEILKILNISLSEIAYMGDDVNDLEAMKLAKIKACPCDAVKEVKLISDFIASVGGGEGAVREFIDWIK